MTAPSTWVPPKQIVTEQYGQATLLALFPQAITQVVLDYLPPPEWYAALEKINALPAVIPPFTQRMAQILVMECPIYGAPHTISDTLTPYLLPAGQVPAGRIHTIDDLTALCGLEPKQIEQLEFDVRFQQSQWIFASKKLLPQSRGLTRAQQMQMIEELCDKSGLQFAMPLYKQAMAVNSLALQYHYPGLWIEEGEGMQETRVQEVHRQRDDAINFPYSGIKSYDLTVGSVAQRNIPSVSAVEHESSRPRVGTAVVLTEFEPAPPRLKRRFCSLV